MSCLGVDICTLKNSTQLSRISQSDRSSGASSMSTRTSSPSSNLRKASIKSG